MSEAEDPEAGDPSPRLVAIGASAGGLEAIETFFSGVLPGSPLGFVIVQHLSPDFKSLMVELLSRRTVLKVVQAEDGAKVRAGTIHLIPPGKAMTVNGGCLHIEDRAKGEVVHHPIDEFLISLAADQGSRAVAVILSGSGSDGARGVRAILRAGGRVLVQQLDTARFSSMPQAAINAGASDEILSPDDMGPALRTDMVTAKPRSIYEPIHEPPAKLVHAIRHGAGLDLSSYKTSTVMRRIQRRMLARGFDDMHDYATFTADSREEQDLLFHDMLIGVTEFFRDQQAFEKLAEHVVPKLANLAQSGESVRIWVPGCATGEEVYSIAMLLAEQIGPAAIEGSVRIFATDIHKRSLATAASGLYAASAVRKVPERLTSQYFVKKGKKVQVTQALRRMIIFSPHNVLSDPPFTKIDLISCRNLLIYFEVPAQQRVMNRFSYALKENGFLMLGPSETIGALEHDFGPIDRKWCLFSRRRSTDIRLDGEALPEMAEVQTPPVLSASLPVLARHRRDRRLPLAYDALLERYVPPSLLVDERGELVHSFGDAGLYLVLPRGRASLALADLVRDELRAPLTSAMNHVRRTRQAIELTELRMGTDPEVMLPRLVVAPVHSRAEDELYLLVSFDDMIRPLGDGSQPASLEVGADLQQRMQELERDLHFSEENLQSTIEELETSNEELQASNEELMASNEELQSTNEELHSVNEELHTVSAEHQRKIAELTQLGQDMNNLLSSTDTAAMFVDMELCIRRFTPAVTRIFNVLPQDTGRPFAHITHRLGGVDLTALLEEVLATGQGKTQDVVDEGEHYFRMVAQPYRTHANSINGVTLSFVDISEYRKSDTGGDASRPRPDKLAEPMLALIESLASSDERIADGLRILLSQGNTGSTSRSDIGDKLPLLRFDEVLDEVLALGIVDSACVERRPLPVARASRERLRFVLRGLLALLAEHGGASTYKVRIDSGDSGVAWQVDWHITALSTAAAGAPTAHLSVLQSVIRSVAEIDAATVEPRRDGEFGWRLLWPKHRGDHLEIGDLDAAARSEAAAAAHPANGAIGAPRPKAVST